MTGGAWERERTIGGRPLEKWRPCPCCVRHAERGVKAARRRVVSALAAAGLAALAALCLAGGTAQAEPAAQSASPPMPGGAGRIALVAVAVAAVAAFALLQAIARSRRRRRLTVSDWRAWPPGYDPGRRRPAAVTVPGPASLPRLQRRG